MLALSLPVAVLIAVVVRPLARVIFGYEATQLDLVAVCTWGFLFALLGDAWLEVAVRTFYANQETRVPFAAALCQVVAFVLIALGLTRWIGLAGIPLSAALTVTAQALVLLFLLNRRFRGLLAVGRTALRTVPAALLARFVCCRPPLGATVQLAGRSAGFGGRRAGCSAPDLARNPPVIPSLILGYNCRHV